MKKIYVAGSINMDLVIKTDIFPQNGMTVMGSGFMTNPGGKGANQAVAIAKAEGNVNVIHVTNIKEITSAQCEELEPGDMVIKETGDESHTYLVVYRKDDEMSLVYCDYHNIEEVY